MTARLNYVLDTSAVLAVILGEPAGRGVLEILRRGRQGKRTIGLPFLALMESEYRLLRQFQPQEVSGSLAVIRGWPAEVLESNEEWRHEAARVKAAGGLSLADSWIAALAMLSGAELVHSDKEFDRVAGLRTVKLP